MIQNRREVSLERTRIIFTRLPQFMSLNDETCRIEDFIHYLQYGHKRIRLINNSMSIEVYDLKDRMVITQFLNWFGQYQKHVHPSMLERDTMAELYFMGMDETGTMIEYAEKITGIYPTINVPKLCHMSDEDIMIMECGESSLVTLTLTFHAIRARSGIITAEANELVKNTIMPPGPTQIIPLAWNDPTITSLGFQNLTGMN